MKITRSMDCGNSPKNKLVEDIAVAMEMGDTGFLAPLLDPEASWTHSGGSETSAEAILAMLNEQYKPTILTIDHVMSHGKVGAASGHIKRDNSEQRFCHVIEFTTVKCNKVRRVDSYG